MRQALFTIAPDAPFLETLVTGIMEGRLTHDWPHHGPFWLSDITIFVPTRRARLALANAFATRLGKPCLLPDIRTFGGDISEEEPFLPPLDAPPLPTPVSLIERRLVLAQLVAAWAKTPGGAIGFASPPNGAEILALADSLARLIDDLAIEEIEPRKLADLPPADLAGNWQATLKFLKIAFENWPELLKSMDKADAAPRRNLALARQVEALPMLFGERPVIAAGTTGSVPATARLLGAIMRLKRGTIVLPGLDTGLSPDDHASLLDAAQAPHGHPQYGLARLLDRLGATPGMVEELASEPRPARTKIVRQGLALPEACAHWAQTRAALDPEIGAGVAGLAIIAARTPDIEARAIALAARQGLYEQKTVGIISPDQNLARRIASELQRFGINVDDAAGTPLFQSAAGRLVRQVLALVVGKCGPVDLMGLLRNRACSLGLGRAEISYLADLIERGLLRGQRPRPGLAGLRQTLADNISGASKHVPLRLTKEDGARIETVLTRLEAGIAPLQAIVDAKAIQAAQLAGALATGFKTVTLARETDSNMLLPGRREFENWADELASRPGDGPTFSPDGLDGVLGALMAGIDVRRPGASAREDIAIWGQLEARLQNRDILILAGLNEDIWPRAADPGPWLSRGMRLGIGLEPPERDQGRAAHDFEMALGNGEAIIAFSERIGTAPALPSRLVQRLEAFLGADISRTLRERGNFWIGQAEAIDIPAAGPTPRPAPRPAPAPLANLRPRQLPITEIETLFRSPYDIYAKYVLGLKPLDPLGEEPGGRERGSMIHEVFSRFVIEGHDFAAPDAQALLEQMAREAFEGLEAIGARRDIWLRRFAHAGKLFLAFERARSPEIASRHAEIWGRWEFPLLDGFKLTGRADRIDLRHDGALEILDFKTGAVPDPGAMKNFDTPQLLLEAGMAGVGGFSPLAPGPVTRLDYIKIGAGPEAFEIKPFKLPEGMEIKDGVEVATRRLQLLVSALLLSEVPMVAQLRPATNQRYAGTYDHLARVAEWSLASGDANAGGTGE